MRALTVLLALVITAFLGAQAPNYTPEERAFVSKIETKELYYVPQRGMRFYHFTDENGQQMDHPMVIAGPYRFIRLVSKQEKYDREPKYGIAVEKVQGDKSFKYTIYQNMSGLPMFSPLGGLCLGNPLRWSEEINGKIRSHQVWIGMTPEQATLSVGEPDKVNTTETRKSKQEQWVYVCHRADDASDSHGIKYLYFTKEKCSGIQRED
jgi:hypothetical protein